MKLTGKLHIGTRVCSAPLFYLSGKNWKWLAAGHYSVHGSEIKIILLVSSVLAILHGLEELLTIPPILPFLIFLNKVWWLPAELIGKTNGNHNVLFLKQMALTAALTLSSSNTALRIL